MCGVSGRIEDERTMFVVGVLLGLVGARCEVCVTGRGGLGEAYSVRLFLLCGTGLAGAMARMCRVIALIVAVLGSGSACDMELARIEVGVAVEYDSRCAVDGMVQVGTVWIGMRWVAAAVHMLKGQVACLAMLE